MLYNNTILLTVSGLSSDFYWNMSDMNHTSKKDSTKGLLDMIGTFWMLSFQPTYIKLWKSLPLSALKVRSLN